jgi:hypothetical protein
VFRQKRVQGDQQIPFHVSEIDVVNNHYANNRFVSFRDHAYDPGNFGPRAQREQTGPIATRLSDRPMNEMQRLEVGAVVRVRFPSGDVSWAADLRTGRARAVMRTSGAGIGHGFSFVKEGMYGHGTGRRRWVPMRSNSVSVQR